MDQQLHRLMLAVLAAGLTVFASLEVRSAPPDGPAAVNPLDANRAYQYLEDLCALGPRPSGSKAQLKQQELLVEHFKKLGGKVSVQEFRAKNPLGEGTVPMANIIVQ